MLVAGVDTDRFTPKMVQVAVQSALANADRRRFARSRMASSNMIPTSCTGAGDVCLACRRTRRRIGDDRPGAALRPHRRGRSCARREGCRGRRKWRTRGNDRMGSRRFAHCVAVRTCHRNRNGDPRPADQCVLAAASRLPGARAFADAAAAACPRRRSPPASGSSRPRRWSTFIRRFTIQPIPAIFADSDAWQLRQAFVGKDASTRLAAIRKLLGTGKDGIQKEAARALVARAATLVEPDCQARQGRARPHLGNAGRRLRPGGGALDSGRQPDGRRGRPIAVGRCLRSSAPNVADVGTGRITRLHRPR